MSDDRMIVPFICTACGANLNPKKSICEFCRVAWKMVKQYNGPDIPTRVIESGGYLTTAGYVGSSSYPDTSASYYPDFVINDFNSERDHNGY